MRRISEWLSITLLSLVMLVNAWLVDDAYITFRTVVNAVNGHGLVWNIGERVQVYTHPLWMFLITGLYAVTSELFFSVIVFSWVVSLGAFFVARQVVARHWWSPALLAIALLASKAVLDYTSSGLENPLSYLLAVFFRQAHTVSQHHLCICSARRVMGGAPHNAGYSPYCVSTSISYNTPY